MNPLRDEAAHWYSRAADARKIATDLTDPAARRKMLAVADNYMKIAREAEARAKAHEPDDQSS
jgi:hypothetical protein